MFHQLGRHMTPATVLAFVALVFAITGGAFAATGGSGGNAPAKATAATGRAASLTAATAKKKKPTSTRGPAGPRGATGATGPAGPAGATGPGGAQGPAGNNGANGGEGKAGANGENVTTRAASEAECKEKVGGTAFTVAGKTEHVCNGKSGTTGFTETLPAGKTETGTWAYGSSASYVCVGDPGKGNFTESECKTSAGTPGSGNFEIAPVRYEGSPQFAPISFSIPLANPLSDSGCEEASKDPCQVHYVTLQEVAEGHAPEQCQGSVAAPSAAPGNLCVYGFAESEVEESDMGILPPGGLPKVPLPLVEFGAGVSGALIVVVSHDAGHGSIFVNGSWAVTAE
jgi:hypothetical protein